MKVSESYGEGKITHFQVEKPTTLRQAFQSHFGGYNLEELLYRGAFYADKVRIFQDQPLNPETVVRVHLHPRRFPVEQINWPEQIYFQNENFLLLNKPAKIPTHSTLDNFQENCLYQTSKALGQELLITHRLDTETQGLLLFAKNKAFQVGFNKVLQKKAATKIYSAHSEKEVPSGLYTHYMNPQMGAPKKLQNQPQDGWHKCTLEILKVIRHNNEFIHTVQLHTGRTHQIRAQMAHMGAAIIGDTFYGGIKDKRTKLVASFLSFPCPLTQQVFEFQL